MARSAGGATSLRQLPASLGTLEQKMAAREAQLTAMQEALDRLLASKDGAEVKLAA